MLPRSVLHAAAAVLVTAIALAAAGPAKAQTLADAVARAVPRTSGIFGASGFQAERLGLVPQWTQVLGAMEAESKAQARCLADETRCVSAALRAWRRVSIAAAGLDRMAQLRAVNRFFNRWPYKLDRALHGTAEYWATPEEFMSRSGDCEDYAIAKFFLLRQLGFANDELRIVVLYDRGRRIGHAVLAVYTDDDILILDNNSDVVASHRRYPNYTPWYQINETTQWRPSPAHSRNLVLRPASPDLEG